MRQKRRELRWAVFIGSALLLNFPLLSVFNKPVFVFGVPLLFFYVLLAWSLLIFFTYRLSKKQL